MAVRLNRREKYAVAAMGLCIGVFVLFQFLIFPMADRRERLTRAIQVKRETLGELSALGAQYRDIVRQAEAARERFAGRERGFTLFSFLDRLAGQAGIKDQITYMKPSTIPAKNGRPQVSMVEMKVEGATMDKLVPFLQMVETSVNVVYVQRISITQNDKEEGLINTVMQIEAAEI